MHVGGAGRTAISFTPYPKLFCGKITIELFYTATCLIWLLKNLIKHTFLGMQYMHKAKDTCKQDCIKSTFQSHPIPVSLMID